jgi:hypothetical protein
VVPGSDDFPQDSHAPTRFEAFRRGTAAGVVLTAISIGLREALEEPADRPGIVREIELDDPFPPDVPIELHLDWDKPEEAWVVLRPWLLGPSAPPRSGR